MKKWIKVQSVHHILPDFFPLLKELEKIDEIQRMIPGRINRKQKGSSGQRVCFSYTIRTGLKYKMSKGSTSQELFVVCDKKESEGIKILIYNQIEKMDYK